MSLVQAIHSLEEESYKEYLDHYGIEIKNEEVGDIKSLVDILRDQTSNNSIFNGFYVGYKIPQIGKEFDLLRFGKEDVINIELKSTSTQEKIEKQLKRNKYYLSYLGNNQYNFTFVSDTEELFFLNDDLSVKKVDIAFLEDLLKKQIINSLKDVDELFNPSDYLVSPFNSTDKFLGDEYFLTLQQEDIKRLIIQTIKNKTKFSFMSVTGSAGTGKTLLIYDIVKSLRKEKYKALIIHCGYLNKGQHKLVANGWNIIPIKNIKNTDFSKYDVVVLDEAQRIYTEQLSEIEKRIKSINGCCIFSYDKVQTLAKWEEQSDIDSKINSISGILKYKLSEKIRTNKEIASFIKSLFNRKRNHGVINKGNIELNYFKSLEDAKNYLEVLDELEWEILRFTPSQYNNEHHEKYSDITNKSSHNVIGQEFDGVVVTIDKLFSYGENGELLYRGKAYYHPVKMLFQNITRTRKKLNLVIIDNEEILNRCISVLKN